VVDGAVHGNSANNIVCSLDGTMTLYDQYAGSLECIGIPISKEYVLNECHQGRPVNLYGMSLNFDCCNPSSTCCTSDFTGTCWSHRRCAMTDEDIYWNGELCDKETGTSGGGGETTTNDTNYPPIRNTVTYMDSCKDACVPCIEGVTISCNAMQC
jgi:hypothetical protein